MTKREKLDLERRGIFPGNCPIRERTGDGISVGRCWHALAGGHCIRHGDVSAQVEEYVRTGRLQEKPASEASE